MYFQPDFVTSMFDVSASFNMLNLNDTEIGLFTGIVLVTAGKSSKAMEVAGSTIPYLSLSCFLLFK